MMRRVLSRRIVGAAALIAGVTGITVSGASAAVTSISSSSTVLAGSLDIIGTTVAIGPVLPSAGSAPPAYDVDNSLAKFSLTSGLLSITSGLLVDTASSPFPPTATGTASSTIHDLSITYDSIFSLTATLISSTSSVDAIPSATGSSTITSLTITTPLETVTYSDTPPVDDVIFDLGGLTITLNQQILDTSESAGITTNAIAVDFTNFPGGLGLVSGSVDIAQSMASIDVTSTTVPEASTWAMILLGFAGLGLAGWRGSRKTASHAA